MRLHDLGPAKGAKKKRRRVGRGDASGRGSYSGRGIKGQKARSGGAMPPWFEGGQLPLVRRLPFRRGFTNIFRQEYTEVNLDRLRAFPPGSEVTPQEMAQAGIIKGTKRPVKVLARGELDRPLVVVAHRFSAAAREKILAAGGQVKEIPR